MAVKRDYGGFARASARLLAPQIESLGYRPWAGGGFGRERDGWIDGFFLQQSQWGSGAFRLRVGIRVPRLDELRTLEAGKPSFASSCCWRAGNPTQRDGSATQRPTSPGPRIGMPGPGASATSRRRERS